jgi:hypothetical protein
MVIWLSLRGGALVWEWHYAKRNRERAESGRRMQAERGRTRNYLTTGQATRPHQEPLRGIAPSAQQLSPMRWEFLFGDVRNRSQFHLVDEPDPGVGVGVGDGVGLPGGTFGPGGVGGIDGAESADGFALLGAPVGGLVSPLCSWPLSSQPRKATLKTSPIHTATVKIAGRVRMAGS